MMTELSFLGGETI